ncbi:hypothetical protein [Methanobacterium spitsbergense]|nr:hypothetical protein [Methanobacterium spitsbergense]
MINDDNKGLFFSLDMVLALIPIFILILNVTNANICYTHFYLTKHYFMEAQDTSELMTQCTVFDDQTVLEGISKALSESKDPIQGIESAKKIADPFLKKTLGNRNYLFVEMNYLKGMEITSRGNFEDAENVGVAVKSNGNYIFKLYVWE